MQRTLRAHPGRRPLHGAREPAPGDDAARLSREHDPHHERSAPMTRTIGIVPRSRRAACRSTVPGSGRYLEGGARYGNSLRATRADNSRETQGGKMTTKKLLWLVLGAIGLPLLIEGSNGCGFQSPGASSI